jgi:hypothetical protein
MTESSDWNIDVFKRFMKRKINFELLETFLEDERVKVIKNRADSFDGFK